MGRSSALGSVLVLACTTNDDMNTSTVVGTSTGSSTTLTSTDTEVADGASDTDTVGGSTTVPQSG